MATVNDPTPRTPDAVILVPGVAGSELVDPANNDLVWGLRPKLLERVLGSGSIFDRLRDDTLVAGDLLQVRAFLPGLGRFDPYTALANALKHDLCTDPAGFAAYPYDWRQPLQVTAAGLAEFAGKHLETWRQHPNGSREARVCFVAHSMGGLLARHATNVSDGIDRDDVAMILTLGTPFGGSIKALRAIGHGDILPLGRHAERVRTLLRETPSWYDLLPYYPSLTNDPTKPGATPPTIDDYVSVGGDRELAQQAATTRAHLDAELTAWPEARLVTLMGTTQTTHQSFSVNAGELTLHHQVDGKDWGGDGTVYAGAAYPKGQTPAHPLPQQHGPIAKSKEGITWVKAMIQHHTLGPPQGDGIGIDIPDAVLTATPVPVTINTNGLGGITISITNTSGRPLTPPRLKRNGNHLTGELTFTQPGLYEITATGGGYSPVTSDVLALTS